MKIIVITVILAFLVLASVILGNQKSSAELIEGKERNQFPPIPSSTITTVTITKTEARALAAADTLKRAPIFESKPEDKLTEKEFIALAKAIDGNYDLDNIVDAVEALENRRAKGNIKYVGQPTAQITSNPTGWSVEYRGWVDYMKNRGTSITVTTNATPEIDPKTYIFICTKENGQSCGQKKVDCGNSNNCVARFP